ncbi:hypothetical protein [Dietzia maris]
MWSSPHLVVVFLDARVAPPDADDYAPRADVPLHLRVTSAIRDRHATME